jgi:hypothetical protein
MNRFFVATTICEACCLAVEYESRLKGADPPG